MPQLRRAGQSPCWVGMSQIPLTGPSTTKMGRNWSLSPTASLDSPKTRAHKVVPHVSCLALPNFWYEHLCRTEKYLLGQQCRTAAVTYFTVQLQTAFKKYKKKFKLRPLENTSKCYNKQTQQHHNAPELLTPHPSAQACSLLTPPRWVVLLPPHSAWNLNTDHLEQQSKLLRLSCLDYGNRMGRGSQCSYYTDFPLTFWTTGRLTSLLFCAWYYTTCSWMYFAYGKYQNVNHCFC